MQIETFEEISIDEDTLTHEEVSEEALALIDTLGLEGQQQLLKRDTIATEETTERRIPYRLITLEESRVYQLVMPEKTRLEAFALAPIPLRVLQVAAHAKDMFDKVEVWHQRSAKEDPVLVGIRKEPGSTWREQTFLLARWGDVLVPLAELRAKAREVLRAKTLLKVREAEAEIRTFTQTIDEKIDAFLLGETVSAPFVSLSLER